jgi:hypothetical protein
MNGIPFSVYDFFEYLASGFLLIVALDYSRSQQWVLRDDLSVVWGLFWVIIAYITGQILAGPSAWLLERIIVGRWLMRPSTNLFRDPPNKWWARLFPGYFTPFPQAIRNKVQDKAKANGISEIGEALFINAFGQVKTDERVMARLTAFASLYGFCRNVSVACLLAASIIGIGSWQTGAMHKLSWALVALVGSIGMFYRYLKFFRQYSYELFITYATLLPKPGDRD